MKFCFWPEHEYGCPLVSHCPHLGGASLGTLVSAASDHDDHFKMVYGQLDFERERNSRLVEENEQLRKERDQLRLELKLERQNKFAWGAQKGSELFTNKSDPFFTPAAPNIFACPVPLKKWLLPRNLRVQLPRLPARRFCGGGKTTHPHQAQTTFARFAHTAFCDLRQF